MRARTREEVLALLRGEKLNKDTILDLEETFTSFEDDGENEIVYLDTKPKTCYSCGGSLFWISKHNGYLYCAVCHPPADQSIVAGWREYQINNKKRG